MLGRDNQIGSESELKTTAVGVAIDGRNHRLAEIPKLSDTSEATAAPICTGRFTFRRSLEIPAGTEELLAATGDDSNPKVRVIAELDEGVVKRAARWRIHRIRLRAIERDDQDLTVNFNAYW